MKNTITPEEHARIKRRRWRQTLGLLITVLVLIGFITVLRAGVGLVANLFDDTAQKQEYEDKLEGLVLFDPMPFDGIENIDDLTLREAAVWGCVYSIQETQGSFDNYNTDPDTEQLLLPSVDVDAYLAKLVGPSFKMNHKTFEMEDMTVEFDETTQCYKIPVTGSVGSYSATVTKLFKKDGLLHVTVGYIPTQSADDSILNTCRLFFQIRNIPSFCTIYALVNNMIPAMIRRTFTIHVAVTPLYSNVYFPNTPAIPHKNPPVMVSAVPLTVSFRSNRSVRFSCAVLFFVVCGFPFVIFPCIPLFCLVCLFYCIL